MLLTTGPQRAAGPLPAPDRLTPYRFGVADVAVSVSLPTGTVMAAMNIPAVNGLMRHEGGVGALWVNGRRAGRTVMLATNLPGVGVRMVLTDNSDVAGPQTRKGWNVWSSPPTLRPEVTVELIKTGAMQPGILSRVMPDVQYRLSSGQGSQGQSVHVERLHYVGHLSVALTEAGHGKQGLRLS